MKFKETNREECGIITDGDIHELPVHRSYLWGKNKRIFISHVLAKILLCFSVLPAGIQPELSPPKADTFISVSSSVGFQKIRVTRGCETQERRKDKPTNKKMPEPTLVKSFPRRSTAECQLGDMFPQDK